LTVKRRESFWIAVDGEVAACPKGLIVESNASRARPTVRYRTLNCPREVKD
jgi:hypothetical protein